jgi:hypothetical protein
VWNKNKVIVTCVQFKMNGSICKNEPTNHDKYMADNTAISQVTGGVPVRVIQNWMDRPIEVVSSKGGTLVVVNPFDNLVTTGVSFWPPPEIVQKLYQSRQIRAFDGHNREAVTRILGFYTDLQSLHSEDAITWSVFGTLAYADQSTKCKFVDSLLKILRITTPVTTTANIFLWRRIPHPDTLVSGGPEIDFGIQTDHVVIFGEAKWLSNIGHAQGKARDKDQIILRREFFEKYGNTIFGKASHYIVLGVSYRGGMIKSEEINLRHATLHLHDMTWESLCSIESHPVSKEIRCYLEWKEKNSRMT